MYTTKFKVYVHFFCTFSVVLSVYQKILKLQLFHIHPLSFFFKVASSVLTAEQISDVLSTKGIKLLSE